MKPRMHKTDWTCDFCQKVTDTLYFHGDQNACEACHTQIVRRDRANGDKNKGKEAGRNENGT